MNYCYSKLYKIKYNHKNLIVKYETSQLYLQEKMHIPPHILVIKSNDQQIKFSNQNFRKNQTEIIY